MKSHYFFSSVTRCSDLWQRPFDVQKLDRGDWATGDFVVGRITGDRSRLRLNAAYAPAEYAFGGSVLGVTTDELDQRLEVEAMWTLSF